MIHFKSLWRTYKKSFYSLLFFCEYQLLTFYQNLKKSYIYQIGLSKFFGISIAQKIHHSLHLTYLFEGKQYEIYLPLDNRLKSRMINDSIEIDKKINEDQITTQILQQQLGVPFFVTANQMGVERIRVISMDQDKVFEGNQKVLL